MMSLPVWLPGPMFLLGSLSLVPCSFQGVFPDRRPPGQRPPRQRPPLYGKEQAVRILLEYILVQGAVSTKHSIFPKMLVGNK